jgi:alpha,alpha-trehalase
MVAWSISERAMAIERAQGKQRRRDVRRVVWLSAAVALTFGVTCVGLARTAAESSPAEVFEELFARVQRERVFSDSKTFVDAMPRRAPQEILRAYRETQTAPGFDLRRFVSEQFALPQPALVPFQTQPGDSLIAHIDRLWPVLERMPDMSEAYSSRIALPNKYLVPGGRFREVYYWDSYFSMLGLMQSGRHDLSASMVDNFAWLIERYGFVPNGTRTYYLSRSQPPVFALMVDLLAAHSGSRMYVKYLSALRREHAFWMEGEADLKPGQSHRRVVRLPDGALLNRYWDDLTTPREEAYLEDMAVAQHNNRPAPEVFRNLRAAAESGWDFSSRWLADGKTLATIRTTELLPVDLNSLLYRLELSIAQGCEQAADSACVQDMQARTSARRAAVAKYLWNSAVGAFTDYAFVERKSNPQLTAASVFPLFAGLSTPAQTRAVAGKVRTQLLQPHGLATTRVHTGQQWDAPNGWAPLQWIAIEGLRSNGEAALAQEIAQRWVSANARVFRATGKLVE